MYHEMVLNTSCQIPVASVIKEVSRPNVIASTRIHPEIGRVRNDSNVRNIFSAVDSLARQFGEVLCGICLRSPVTQNWEV